MSNNQLAVYMRSDAVLQRFSDVVGGEHAAKSYVSSVILAVANSKVLQNCNPQSIATAALRAATLQLSVDPATKQAYLVPYGNEAKLIVGWKGLYDMALRTGRYRYINVSPVPKGKTIVFDIFTGAPSIEYDESSNGGWVASFQMTEKYGNNSKTVYMSLEEIEEHKEQYSKGWQRKDSAWQTAPKAMQKKTVLRHLLLNWGYFSETDRLQIQSIEEDGVVDAEIMPDVVDGESRQRRSANQALAELGFGGEALADDDLLDVDNAFNAKTAFERAVTEAGLNNNVAKKILQECEGDYEAALKVIQEQHTPPTE